VNLHQLKLRQTQLYAELAFATEAAYDAVRINALKDALIAALEEECLWWELRMPAETDADEPYCVGGRL
jgi:hypothetical protein